MNGTDRSAQSFVWANQHNTAGVGTWGSVALEIIGTLPSNSLGYRSSLLAFS
jgi:hypothetical protein